MSDCDDGSGLFPVQCQGKTEIAAWIHGRFPGHAHLGVGRAWDGNPDEPEASGTLGGTDDAASFV